MKIVLGCFGIFLATVLFLSIEVNNRPIFGHIYKAISPATKSAQNATEEFFGSSVKTTKTYSKKLFDNSTPKIGDSVKSKMSAVRKKNAAPEETITVEEKQELDELIKSHH
jgi:hypothetical protein